MRESVVERYLHLSVVRAGGTTYKWVSPGRPGVPDRIVIWPGLTPQQPAILDLVECKAPGKAARAGQAREHVRLMKLGCRVLILDSKTAVDTYIAGPLRCV